MPEDFILQASNVLPCVKFHADGKLLLRGRFLSDHLFSFFHPLHQWVADIMVPRVELEFDLDYIPTNAFNGVRELLRLICENNNIREISVQWTYDYDDEELHEKGLILQEQFPDADFHFMGRENTEETEGYIV